MCALSSLPVVNILWYQLETRGFTIKDTYFVINVKTKGNIT